MFKTKRQFRIQDTTPRTYFEHIKNENEKVSINSIQEVLIQRV